ncbi:MAG: hypothetical protein ABSG33_04235 [Candidatus Bathyarchaeia archaeon]|jgi:hypothetical protein
MGQILKIRELERDDELGSVKKQISAQNGDFSFETPVVSQRRPKTTEGLNPLKINEVSRPITKKSINELETRGITPFAYEIKREQFTDRLNLTLFNLTFDRVPDERTTRLLANALYSSSKDVMVLPTVRAALLQEIIPTRKTPVYSIRKIDDYLKMMRTIIDTNKFRNGKELVGTIPLIPPKFVRPIIDFYIEQEIQAFAIDANFKDIILNEGDFRLILTEINNEKPLNETVIFAFNVGNPQYEQHAIRSDDFLSIFAYVDVLGLTSKPRFGGGSSRAKVFSREDYAYDVYPTYSAASQAIGKNLTYYTLKEHNRLEQLKETYKVRGIIGDEKVKKYLQTKEGVDTVSMKKLESIAHNIRVS